MTFRAVARVEIGAGEQQKRNELIVGLENVVDELNKLYDADGLTRILDQLACEVEQGERD